MMAGHGPGVPALGIHAATSRPATCIFWGADEVSAAIDRLDAISVATRTTT